MKALTLPSVTSALVRAGVQTIVSWPEQVDGGPVMIVADERRLETFLAPPNTTLYVSTNAVVAVATLDCVPVENCSGERAHLCTPVGDRGLLHSPLSKPWPDGETEHDVSDQLDFLYLDAPFALVLSDVRPVGPITDMPCPGKLDDKDPGCRAVDGYPLCDGTGVVPIPSHSGLWGPPQALAALIEGETP